MTRAGRRISIVVVCAVLPFGLRPTLSGQQPAQPGTLALVGGMLLDGWGGPPVHHATVVITANRIVAAGAASEIVVPKDATIIDASGRTIMPGLIEAHAHLFILGHGEYSRWFPWVIERGLKERVMEISARQLLNAGITTAITLGDPIEVLRVRDRVNKGELPGSRIFTAGRMLVQRRAGAPAGRLDDMRFTYPVDTAEDIARVVNELADAGVDLIKVQSGFRALHYRAAVDAAHQRGLKVHAHVYTEDEVREAFEAGVDVLQHVGSGGTSPPYTAELVRRIVQAGRPVVDTIAHRSWVYPATEAFPERLQDPQLKQDFGAQIYQEVQDSFKNWHTLGYFNRIDSELFFREQVAKQWIESGAILGMGTDSGTPMNFHTEALWREMKAHVDMGMPASRVIVAATRINATRILGRTDIGTIEPGKLADLIVVVGNPLYDMTALSHVQIVVKNGVVYKGASVKPAAGKSSQ
jgi:imidazolonepropionase-like amidohydrolase